MSEPVFSVLIAWSGPEDKPFYRALLVSASQAALIDHQSFWGYAVISEEELDRLISVLAAHGRTLKPGAYAGAGPEYYVELRRDGQAAHCSIGFDREMLEILTRMADALAEAHRQPIRDIVARIRSAVEQHGSTS